MSVLADKDYRSMIRAVAPLGSAWVCVTSPNAPRALSGDDLARAVRDEVASDEVAVACRSIGYYGYIYNSHCVAELIQPFWTSSAIAK
jgi:folylpolyglutamate synthase/dihydropteroate synthase